jgi:hypothetical protein
MPPSSRVGKKGVSETPFWPCGPHGQQWVIGDALIKDAGPTGRNIAECAKKLKELGFDYKTGTLREHATCD